MKAVILAAGKSTRTYPLTLTTPKPMLKVAGKTILEHNLEQLNDIVDEVIIIVSYLKEKITKLGNRFKKIKVTYVEQKEKYGTGGALLTAKQHLDSEFIVINGDDIYFREDIKNLIKKRNSILIKKIEDASNFGLVEISGDKVIKITEKQPNASGYVNCGAYFLTKEIFNYDIKKSPRNEYEITDFIKKLIPHGLNYCVAKNWFPLTYPWDLFEINEFFLKKIKTRIKGKVEKNSVVRKAYIGKNTIIKSGAYIEGPVYIGENCTIGPNCYIRAFTYIDDNCKIGNGVEIKNSIIYSNTKISHLGYVGDSIIGNNVNFGAGTIIANLRHDRDTIKTPVKAVMVDTKRKKLGAIIGDNVKTGINTSIYPGRKLWPNTSTLPGEIVKKDKTNNKRW